MSSEMASEQAGQRDSERVGWWTSGSASGTAATRTHAAVREQRVASSGHGGGGQQRAADVAMDERLIRY